MKGKNGIYVENIRLTCKIPALNRKPEVKKWLKCCEDKINEPAMRRKIEAEFDKRIRVFCRSMAYGPPIENER